MSKRILKLTTAHCDLCAHTEARLIGTHPDISESQIVACARCNAVYTSPMPTPERLAALYSHEYRQSLDAVSSQKRLEDFQHRANAQKLYIQNRLNRGFKDSTILDIGCGSGPLLNAFANGSNTLIGFEPDPAIYSIALEKLGQKACIYNQMFDASLVAEHTFDLIVLSHVLEHVPNPVGLLAELLSLLKSDGVIFVEVPNESLKSVWEQARYCVRGFIHLWFFRPKSLTAVVKKAGGEVVDLTTYGPKLRDFSKVHLSRRGWQGAVLWNGCRVFRKLSHGKIDLQHRLTALIDRADFPTENDQEGNRIRALIVNAPD